MSNYLMSISDDKPVDFDELMEQPIEILKMIAIKRDTPALVLANLACHRDKTIRAEVARNQSTPVDVLTMLSRDSESSVYTAVAANPSTSPEVIGYLISNSGYARKHAFANDNAPLQNILMYMLSNIEDGEKTALNFNGSFQKLLEIACKIDANNEQSFEYAKRTGKDIDANDYEADVEEPHRDSERWG